MAIRIVQSKQNARVKELRAALLRPGRGATGLIALEGFHLLSEALLSHLEIITIFIAIGSEALLISLSLPSAVEIIAVPEDVLKSAVTTETPQPIAALVRPRDWNWGDLLETKRTQLLVVLAGIQDPGNLGTILRSAEAFGASGVICLPGTVSQWNSKGMRASAGSVFRLPVLTASENECFDRLHQSSILTVAAMARLAVPLQDQDLSRSSALIIGSEGSGLSEELAARCDVRVTIPCPGPVESLNAAVAASILLYEASCQRTPGRPPKRKPRI